MNKIKRCKTCMSCQTIFRWEAIYKAFLEENPNKGFKKFIARQRRLDKKTLVCLRMVFSPERDWQDGLAYDENVQQNLEVN